MPHILGGGYVHPKTESLTISATPLSYCTMELPPGETLPVRGYVELFTVMGSAGIFRVRSMSSAYGDFTTTAELEHAIVEIGDYMVLETIEDLEIGLADAMQRVFQSYRGSRWQLGDVSALGNDTFLFSCDHERILDTVLTLMQRKPKCMLAFDFSTSPWTVSVRQMDTAVTAQGRLTRNIISAEVTVDDTDLCTRAYYQTKTGSGSSEIVSWQYIEDAAAIQQYGVIERPVHSGSDMSNDQIAATAQEYLRVHKKPRTGVSVNGVDLSDATGENVDRFEIGKLLRLDLSGWGIDYAEENISQLAWNDVYGDPFGVQITLAEETETAVDYIHQIDANGGTVSGGQAKRR